MSDPLESGDPPVELRLTTAEWGMWQAFRNGSVYDLRSGDAALDDPASDEEWGPGRTVRARVIALLLLHGPPPLLGRVASLHLTGAVVTGVLDLSGGSVDPYFEMRQCRFTDEVRMPEARVRTARIATCRLPRFEAARLTTEGDLHLPRCTIPGGIKLTDATIGTDLLLSESTIGSEGRTRAIAADGLNIGQELQAELLYTDGETSLRGATIGSSLQMCGARLRNTKGPLALYAPQLTVGHTAGFSDAGPERTPQIEGATPPAGVAVVTAGGAPWAVKHFECTGGIVLDDGRFGSSLVIENARFRLRMAQEISLRRISTPELKFTPQVPEQGLLVLSGAAVEKLVDQVSSWPQDHRLWMAGFTYRQAIPKAGHFNVHERLRWVATATPEYSPEPYEQLATMYRNCGEDTNARRVLLARHRRRRETLPLVGKAWGYLQDWTVAYGYRPAQAALWMGVLWASASLLFAGHPPAPLKENESPQWNAVLYALDLLLPVISLGQDTAWNPEGGYQWAAAALILLGWVLATTVATGATRLLRRQ